MVLVLYCNPPESLHVALVLSLLAQTAQLCHMTGTTKEWMMRQSSLAHDIKVWLMFVSFAAVIFASPTENLWVSLRSTFKSQTLETDSFAKGWIILLTKCWNKRSGCMNPADKRNACFNALILSARRIMEKNHVIQRRMIPNFQWWNGSKSYELCSALKFSKMTT